MIKKIPSIGFHLFCIYVNNDSTAIISAISVASFQLQLSTTSPQKITQQHNKLVHLIILCPHIILQAILCVSDVISTSLIPPRPRDPALWKIITLASGGGAQSSPRMSIKSSGYRWLITAVRWNLTASRVRRRRARQGGGSLAVMVATGQSRSGLARREAW